jgi:hypothetical protein
MSLRFKLLAVTAALVIGTGASFAAEGDKVGDEQMCIEAHDIDQTTVIGHEMIVVKMRGATRGYKRIDIANHCTALNNAEPFAFDTNINKLCKQTTLKTSSQTCLIDKITTIDEAEAKALLAKKRG